jgi:Spy/CpxP family protein refolding chaperone
MKKNIWLLVALIAITFLSGAVAGFFTGRLTAHRRPRRYRKAGWSRANMKAMFQSRICKRLNLTAEQEKKAKPIIDRWFEEMGELHKLHAPLYTTVFKKFYAKMAPLLSPEQKVELDKWREKTRNKYQNKHNKKQP